MQRDQQAGQDGGQGEFNHHQTVQGRSGQHHHRAKGHLHEAQPDN